MLEAINFQKVEKALMNARQQAKSEMPNSAFVFIGVDNEYLFFNLVARKSEITEHQIRDLKEKTRFQLISEDDNKIYKVECKVSL